jgi:hypothetical protein
VAQSVPEKKRRHRLTFRARDPILVVDSSEPSGPAARMSQRGTGGKARRLRLKTESPPLLVAALHIAADRATHGWKLPETARASRASVESYKPRGV